MSASPRSIVRIMEAVQVESVILAPLLARERSVGEFMIGSRAADFFNSKDMQMLSDRGRTAGCGSGRRGFAQSDR